MDSRAGGLTPPIPKYTADAVRRIFLGGFTSNVVYSNISALAESTPDWVKQTKNTRFQCAFLFRPTMSILKFPIVAIVPEHIFARSFVKDDFSIVKVFQHEYFGPVKANIPGAYKSAVDFSLAPNYFIGSPKFDLRAVLREAVGGQLVNPARLFRGLSVFSVGSVMVMDATKRLSNID